MVNLKRWMAKVAKKVTKLPIENGGTNGTTLAQARLNLGITHANLSSVDNLNNIYGTNAAGFYYLLQGVQNAPVSWAWMLVLGGVGTYQLVFQAGAIYARAYTGNPLAWSPWRRVTLNSI